MFDAQTFELLDTWFAGNGTMSFSLAGGVLHLLSVTRILFIDTATGEETRPALTLPIDGNRDLPQEIHVWQGPIFATKGQDLHEVDQETGELSLIGPIEAIPGATFVSAVASPVGGLAFGGPGRDVMEADLAGMQLQGRCGNDVLRALDEGAELVGQLGDDRLEGDAGRDVFAFNRKDGARHDPRLAGPARQDRVRERGRPLPRPDHPTAGRRRDHRRASRRRKDHRGGRRG